MARIARVVVPGIPHHIIQRGNRRQKVFFSDSDKNTLDSLCNYMFSQLVLKLTETNRHFPY